MSQFTAITEWMEAKSRVEVVDTSIPSPYPMRTGFIKYMTGEEWCERAAKRIRKKGGSAWVERDGTKVALVRSSSEVKDE